MKPLNPMTIRLSGINLIEASAGTGKTYTITTLYLRLLLELGLEVDQILVVTYTQAATEELRDRIRHRLAQAEEWARAALGSGAPDDPVLTLLLNDPSRREKAAKALRAALSRMDEAAIFTIHGFCQRALQDHAFESGAAFELEMITDETLLKTTAMQDFWRRQVTTVSRDTARWILHSWSTPAQLLEQLTSTLALDDLRVLPPIDAATLKVQEQQLHGLFAQLRASWASQAPAIKALLEQSEDLKRAGIYRKDRLTKLLDIAAMLFTEAQWPLELPEFFERLTPQKLEENTKAGRNPPFHPFFDLCGQWHSAFPRYQAARRAFTLATARQTLREALEQRKRSENLMYFDDLLRRLDRALQDAGGNALAAQVRQRFPVALIDEFQDTDPQQYRIFRNIYPDDANPSLFLIGDPKQAIYAFRGGDIFTYMQARRDSDTENGQYTLQVNYRSGSALITAVNTLFGKAHKPFIYDQDIPFHPVAPSPTADAQRLLIEGHEPHPLQLWMLKVTEENQTSRPPGFISADQALEAAALACAESIAHWLNLAAAGQATLGTEPLLPRDIAVLVRSHKEAAIIQEALRRCGVHSVTLSQSSVFHGEDAEELEILLAALADPYDEDLLRAALATPLLGRHALELVEVTQNEICWEQLIQTFMEYRRIWSEKGFMVAIQNLLHQENIMDRLLRRPDGERRLTNLLQLIELLQVAARDHPGLDALLRWFREERTTEGPDDARQLRLESDEGLVKVVTMHKSKGLQYPLVWIPFPWSHFNAKHHAPPFYHDDATACLDLGSEALKQHRVQEQQEQLAERLRLFYVAVTRAARLCLLCWGRVNMAGGAALAYLLHQDTAAAAPASRMAQLTEEQIREDVHNLAQQAPDSILVRDLPEPGLHPAYCPPGIGETALAAKTFPANRWIDHSWRVVSYSGLTRDLDTEQPDHDAGTTSQTLGAPAQNAGIFALPASAQTGEMLHGILEHLDFPAAQGEVLNAAVRDALQRYDQLRSPDSVQTQDWTPTVSDLVTQVLDTPLDDSGALRLRDIPRQDRLNELEFHCAFEGLDGRGLLQTLDPTRHLAGSIWEKTRLRGLLRGFIDLVFRHENRYYLVDYKSNRLGFQLEDYDQAGMRQAVIEHHYDLQYHIYAVALHRFLQQRLASYHYETHFGGMFYLFMRGMNPAQGPRYGVWRVRPDQTEMQRLEACFAQRSMS